MRKKGFLEVTITKLINNKVMRASIYSIVLIILPLFCSAQLKVACIGDNNILGSQLSLSQTLPEKLQEKLGPSYKVKNFGVQKASYKQSADSSFWKHPKLNEVVAYEPDIVIVMLGLEDTKTGWSKYDAWFLMEKLRFMKSNPHVFIALPTPVYANSLGYTDAFTTINNDLVSVSRNNEVNLVDTRTPFLNAAGLFSDGVFLNATGTDSLATFFSNYLKSKDLKRRISVAVIGNSITEGSGADYSTLYKIEKRYSAILWDSLGRNEYVVHNFGKSGTTLMKNTGDAWPYYNQDGGKLWKYSRSCEPDIVLIMLGTNDAKTSYASYRHAFETDAKAIIDSFAILPSNPKIFIVLPPDFCANGYTINPDTVTYTIVPRLQSAAAAKGVETINLHTIPITFHDCVHPNTAGAATIGNELFKVLKNVVINQPTDIRKNGILMNTIHPNPTSGMLYFSTKMENETVIVNNLLGTCMLNQQISGNALNISMLSKGFYLVKTKTETFKVYKE